MSVQHRASVVIDLDGVVWLAGEPLDGVDEAIELLRRAGLSTIFATNNSSPTLGTLLERLARAGIEASASEVVTAAQAAVSLVPASSTAMIVGEDGLWEAAEARRLIESPSPASVLVGWKRTFDFETVAGAASAVRRGALLVATNDDPTHPTPDGLLPGTGALVASIATAAEARAVIAGKPGAAMADLVTARSESIELVIGDRPSTDGAFALRLDAPFALVTSEATPAGDHAASIVAPSLLSAVQEHLETRDR